MFESPTGDALTRVHTLYTPLRTAAATLHNVFTNKVYHASLPDPPFRCRYIIGSSHGWLVTADKHSSLHLLNPVTSTQLALPMPQSIKGVRASFSSDGALIGYYIDTPNVMFRSISNHVKPQFLPPEKTRQLLYQKIVLSSDRSDGDCTVLLRHRPGDLSFARVGDTEWTWLDTMERCELYNDFFFNDNDRCFYAVREDGEVHTIDLNGPSPIVKVIFNGLSWQNTCPYYILLSSWGDIFHIRRIYDPPDHKSYSDEEHEQNHKVDLAEQKVTKIKDL
ncbi:hypothetical protein PR202_gb05735 [Eleusine coracana subsp. coracana]|uniref:KIB1-4 beta-propeller domain-containing protein n=1 Tax=Eleusine coracana subsp. coracana TaxID=191504 RepID=A0AAV5E827_ELECO|nr:hypothetical protein PR202_gb05735 [Eleusine coracana subsp. coracana]